jgi:hypothetical protein
MVTHLDIDFQINWIPGKFYPGNSFPNLGDHTFERTMNRSQIRILNTEADY